MKGGLFLSRIYSPFTLHQTPFTRNNRVDVPRHIEEEFELVGGHLGVVDVGNPQSAAVVVVGGTHLGVDEAGLSGGEPEVVVRTAPIAEVVVDASPTLPLLLFGIGQTGEIAVVVVAPHERDVVGHAETALHNLEHLLIGDEDLGDALHILIIMLADELALVVDDLLQAVEFLLGRLHALHRTVVDAAHTEGEEHVAALHLLQAVGPVAAHFSTICDVVIRSPLFHIPLSDVVAKQWFTVAGADDDAEGVGHLLVALDGVEARRHIVHGGPEGVGTQTEHQLEQAAVGLRSHVVGRPATEAPVLVVDEDAAIGD